MIRGDERILNMGRRLLLADLERHRTLADREISETAAAHASATFWLANALKRYLPGRRTDTEMPL